MQREKEDDTGETKGGVDLQLEEVDESADETDSKMSQSIDFSRSGEHN